MDEYLGPTKTKSDKLFLKLVKIVEKQEYTMHFMEDRHGRKAMFYNYKGVEIRKDDCVLIKATIAEHRTNRYDDGKPLTYLNRVTVRENRGSKENPKIVFGEIATERGSSSKNWEEPLSEEDEIEPVQPSLRGLPGKFGN
tara:strand:+ start:1692 stop:2111 length:420 start_codon:yes stop_codon:yes gene_type:complete